ncbi:hypothetical protein [Sedimenticola sp.]|uniref:hypothetical protein n=1 Tax=Sedimenticola sp. TaxID=1940285 RepID=UPI003D0C2843
MSKIVLKTEIDAPPGLVWLTLRYFTLTANWHPFLEQQLHYDDVQQLLVCSMKQSALPIENCSVEIRVSANEKGVSTIHWTGIFCATRRHEMVAAKELQRIFHGYLSQLEAMFNGSGKT